MLKIEEILVATNGKLINGDINVIPQNYIVDSRELNKGDFFVPIVGMKIDAHDFIIDSVRKGIIGFFINKDCNNKKFIINESKKINKDICIIEVNNTQKALYDSGKYNREKHIDIPIVAVTGSVGKTSTREIISSVLKTEKNVLTTIKNYNSMIGIPIMLLKLDKQEICVLEAGIDKIGEMEDESNLLKPNVALITNIGTAHIEAFKSRETIFKEKIQITNHIQSPKILIINSNDELLSKVEKNNDINIININKDMVSIIEQTDENIRFKTRIYNNEEIVNINEIGIHNVYNAMFAVKVGEIFNLKKENIINGISNYKNFSRRLEKIYINGNILLIDDTYNASIDSMRSGLITVNELKCNRKIAVLGDMFELGEKSEELHVEVGKLFKDLKYDILYVLGERAKDIARNAKEYINNVLEFDKKDELIEKLKNEMRSGDIIFFKASNGMKFDEIIKGIRR